MKLMYHSEIWEVVLIYPNVSGSLFWMSTELYVVLKNDRDLLDVPFDECELPELINY